MEVSERTATIVDFAAYRMKKRARVDLSRGEVRAAHGAVLPLVLFSLFLAWVPFAYMGWPGAGHDP
ncbi:hypothetical protein NLM31_08150 [Bradyrhizobium sp. CCGUVB4N]|uniref:hypothetical protein n=1 Tax=Bradyrhizobium sp. CCGUVB4N TaxID=2949631 RepID=UPI0020B222D1|nr:hypothetical protein [Bradyrhizobium sp. CCGUVB4N]MCP3380346.1 hypothetical protein [Bradyrhizobium sp. CCGUVB4N]